MVEQKRKYLFWWELTVFGHPLLSILEHMVRLGPGEDFVSHRPTESEKVMSWTFKRYATIGEFIPGSIDKRFQRRGRPLLTSYGALESKW
jgi:hypothetical protein